MKKVFFFALASLALASCSQDEEFAPEKSKGSNRTETEAISFSTYTAGGTRATDVKSGDVVTSGFQVSAWYDGKKFFSDTALYMNGLAIDATSKIDEAFDTKFDTYWWPRVSSSDTISFRAFNILKSATNKAEWVDENCLQIKYMVADSAKNQEDLVIAYDSVSEKPMAVGKEGVQPLNFTHALSKVNFSFEGAEENFTYTINKVEVIAAGQLDGDAAVMSFAESTRGTGTDTDQPVLNSQAQKVSWKYTHINNKEALVAAGEAAQGVLYTYSVDTIALVSNATKMDDNFMLLPQADSIAIRVYYKVEDKNGKLIGNCGFYKTDKFGRHEGMVGYDETVDEGIYGCKTVVVSLGDVFKSAAGDALGFEAGKSYRFTLTLPKDNFIGDQSGDLTADEVDENGKDVDGDLDDDESEFDDLTPIRFSVTVSNWVDYTPALGNITIK